MSEDKDVKNSQKTVVKPPIKEQNPNQSTTEPGDKYEPLPASAYEWRCENCDAHEPNNTVGWMKIRQHQKGHKVALCEKETGDIVARSYKEALAKEIDVPKTGGQQAGHSSSGGEGKDGDEEDENIMTATGIKETVILPVLTHAYYDAALQHGYIDPDTTFDNFLFNCVQQRFQLEFGVVIGLVRAENIITPDKEGGK
jgi:hypothetical protein